jgi:hypothetical protein
MSFLELNFLEVLAYVVLGAGGLIGSIVIALYVQWRRNK